MTHCIKVIAVITDKNKENYMKSLKLMLMLSSVGVLTVASVAMAAQVKFCPNEPVQMQMITPIKDSKKLSSPHRLKSYLVWDKTDACPCGDKFERLPIIEFDSPYTSIGGYHAKTGTISSEALAKIPAPVTLFYDIWSEPGRGINGTVIRFFQGNQHLQFEPSSYDSPDAVNGAGDFVVLHDESEDHQYPYVVTQMDGFALLPDESACH